MSSDLVFRKTEKGVLELRDRGHGLNARIRQVLILLDGHRRVADLCRMLPEAELHPYLTRLESENFIARQAQPQHPSPGTPILSVVPAAPERAAWQDGQEPLPSLRARVVRALLDATGPNGDGMAARIERCLTVDELRSLLDPAAAIVEAVAGRHARDRFLERIGGAGA